MTENSAMDSLSSQAGTSGMGSITDESTEASAILDPALNLARLGYNQPEQIDWSKVVLKDKSDLYLDLRRCITNKIKADFKVQIGREKFSCHLIVLQCYSEMFDGCSAIDNVEIRADKCSPSAFCFIYDWMVDGGQSYRHLSRENVLDIFSAAKYLKIKDLVQQCWAFIDNSDVFNEDRAFFLYADAMKKNVAEVGQLMIPRIQDFFLILVSSQDWLELSVEGVKDLLSSNHIRINCEVEVFMAAFKWITYDRSRGDKWKYEVIRCVRFGNIPAKQLVVIKTIPEFKELTKDTAICKLIDDGISFVVLKQHLHGPEKERFRHKHFQHWNDFLALQKAPPRNWTGLDKTYFTYREFLLYLDEYRRNDLKQKSKPSVTIQ